MNGIRLFLLIVLSPWATASEPEKPFPLSMTVITGNARPVVNAEAVRNAFALRGNAAQFHIHNLDDVDALEAQLSEGLPANQRLAQQVFEIKVAKIGQKALEKQLIDAYRGVMLAMRFGITRYPAIVFDERYLVVGVNDLSDAVNAYQSFTSQVPSYER